MMSRNQLVLSQPDRDLERRVVNFLAQQHFLRLRAIEVESRQGVVTIRGRVNSFHERQLCIHCCQRVAGVVGLNDQIQVAMCREGEGLRGFFGYPKGSAALAATG
jgi:osmotically-inducible protein OsmY